MLFMSYSKSILKNYWVLTAFLSPSKYACSHQTLGKPGILLQYLWKTLWGKTLVLEHGLVCPFPHVWLQLSTEVYGSFAREYLPANKKRLRGCDENIVSKRQSCVKVALLLPNPINQRLLSLSAEAGNLASLGKKFGWKWLDSSTMASALLYHRLQETWWWVLAVDSTSPVELSAHILTFFQFCCSSIISNSAKNHSKSKVMPKNMKMKSNLFLYLACTKN